MEELQIHSRSYLVRWINVKPEHTISWNLQPHKKSISLAIFKHPGHLGSLTPHLGPATAPPPPTPQSDSFEAQKDTIPSTVVEKLTAIGLKQVAWLGKCEADKISQGKYDVKVDQGGNYAMVFDNTFSKQISKTATLVLLTYPTAHPPQFGAQLHHSQIIPINPSSTNVSRSSPHLRPKGRASIDSLPQTPGQPSLSIPSTTNLHQNIDTAPVHTGVLQKRRRKRHQGFAKRFFSLDFTSSTLSYYHNRNSSALRGAIPLSLAAVGANADTREISIDSGAEIWHLKALNQRDFVAWKDAIEKASKELLSTAASAGLTVETPAPFADRTSRTEDYDWTRVEAVVGRVSGIRDAVRRLTKDTELNNRSTPHLTPQSPISGESPTDREGDGYFRGDGKRPFWKRKPSGNNVTSNNLFRRSVSAQIAVPTPTVEPSLRNDRLRSRSPVKLPHLQEDGVHEHCKAILRDLDAVMAEFAALLTESKIRRQTDPQSAVSRLSMESSLDQEYFDAEERAASPFLRIRGDSVDGGRFGREPPDELDDSASSSEIEDEADFFDSHKGLGLDSSTMLFPLRPKTLLPLPLAHVKRRINVRSPTIPPPSLIGFLRKNVGKDLSTISMPVSANEPTSLLQRAAEQFEYSELLDYAAQTSDEVLRLLYVTAFAISSSSSTRIKERSIRKPFNPMLGETYELVREDKGFRLLAEKVSHRPVQLAIQAESYLWSYTHSPMPSQKFWGKSSEIITDGVARISLHTTNEHYSWTAATSFLRNIIAGEKYVEPVGNMSILNETTGQKAVVTFKAKSMFAGRSEEVSVSTFESHGKPAPLGLAGTWTQSLRLVENNTLTEKVIWTAGPLVDNAPKHYGLTLFAASLNEVTDIEKAKLPPTDSRLRPDQRALEEGEVDRAESLKNRLEERQRERRREMEDGGEEWRARWFSRVEVGGEVVWRMKSGKEGGYWEEREKEKGNGDGGWEGVPRILEV
ncbi:MAG: hypothetical protein Q9227_005295 [Pyrenula ochraceoflavens]